MACHFLQLQNRHHGHPSRLPCGSLRSALTGPGRVANDLLIGENGRLYSGIVRWTRLPLVGAEHSADYGLALHISLDIDRPSHGSTTISRIALRWTASVRASPSHGGQ